MPWGVRLTSSAQRHLFRLTIREAEVVSFNLFRLAEDPVQLSLRPSLREPLGQEYRFRHASGARAVHFTISFRYDEQSETLQIVRIEQEPVPR